MYIFLLSVEVNVENNYDKLFVARNLTNLPNTIIS